MKSIFFAIFVLVSICSCSDDEAKPVVQIPSEIPSISLTTSIINPIKNRDYSFHNNGIYGVFEDPTVQKNLKAKIVLNNNSNASNESLTVKWKSDLDGQLYEGHPDENLESEIDVNLSTGIHKIIFEVYAADDLIKKDSINISNVIKLQGIAETGRSVKLNWSRYEGNDFVSYLIYGQNFTPIAEINNIDALDYEYIETHSLVENRSYQIVVKTTAASTYNVNGSNIISLASGVFSEVPFFVSKVVNDEVHGKIYGIISPRNNDETAGLLVFDNENLSLISHVLQTVAFSDLDLSPDGQFLYLTQKYIEKLTKINLNTFSIETFATSTNNWGFHKIEAGNNNVLYCHGTPPTSGSTGIHILNAQNGSELCLSYYAYLHGDLEYNPVNDKLYHGDSNISSGRISKNSYTGGALQITNTYPIQSSPFGILYPSPFLLVSPDYNSIFWENFQLNNDLQILREFDTHIIACSPNNVYLSDLEKIYDYNSMNVVTAYPSFPENSTRSSVLFTDDHTVIVHKAYRPNITTYPDKTYLFKIKIN